MSFSAWWTQYEKDSDGIMYFVDATEDAWNASRAESEAQIATLQLERDALREALKYARRFLEANEVDLSFIDSVLFPASGEPASERHKL